MDISNRKRRFNETTLTNFQARYGEEVNDIANPTNGFCERVLNRVTTRVFKTDPLAPGMIEKLVAVAQSAPSSHMSQSWSVILVGPGESRNKLKKLLPASAPVNIEMMETAPALLIWVADLSRLALLDIDVSDSEFSMMAVIDATIAAQTLSLCAESFGLGVCYCGSFRTMPLDRIKTILKIPDNSIVVFGMFVGRPAFDKNTIRYGTRIWPKPRLPQNVVLHRNEYRVSTATDLADYDQIVMDYHNKPHVLAKDKEPNLSMSWSASMKRRAARMLTPILGKLQRQGFFTR